jgi:hypothetical protein
VNADGEPVREASADRPRAEKQPRAAYPNTPDTASQERRCTSDYQCGIGHRCMKDSYSLNGVCAKVVDQYGVPQPGAMPRPDSVGVGQGTCSFDTQCPIGFRCVKTSGGLRGNCMR